MKTSIDYIPEMSDEEIEARIRVLKDELKKRKEWPDHIPLCRECLEVRKQTLIDGGEEVVGCNRLTAKQWKDGWKVAQGKTSYQSNCPILGDRNSV